LKVVILEQPPVRCVAAVTLVVAGYRPDTQWGGQAFYRSDQFSSGRAVTFEDITGNTTRSGSCALT
jgi:hypothetical protein